MPTVTVLHVKEQDPRGAIADLCEWAAADERSQCQIREQSRVGEAAKEIISVAAETRCDLLVLGAHHRFFFDSTVIGATRFGRSGMHLARY
jgi:nucleotide-binding universal stress UspA family protein